MEIAATTVHQEDTASEADAHTTMAVAGKTGKGGGGVRGGAEAWVSGVPGVDKGRARTVSACVTIAASAATTGLATPVGRAQEAEAVARVDVERAETEIDPDTQNNTDTDPRHHAQRPASAPVVSSATPSTQSVSLVSHLGAGVHSRSTSRGTNDSRESASSSSPVSISASGSQQPSLLAVAHASISPFAPRSAASSSPQPPATNSLSPAIPLQQHMANVSGKSSSASEKGADSDSVRSSATSKIIRLFPEIGNEEVLYVYNCAIEKEILWQGKLYLTTNHLCFQSAVFGKTERLVLRLHEAISIEKKSTAGVFPNAIKVQTLDGKNVGLYSPIGSRIEGYGVHDSDRTLNRCMRKE
ncbi:hypothetical protein BC830DRAFT_919165 [Chytriomyces sp. MP71]|nr:hypothetical protein BC830DRAFT_919165 [Chytriomyces sp. MP71]